MIHNDPQGRRHPPPLVQAQRPAQRGGAHGSTRSTDNTNTTGGNTMHKTTLAAAYIATALAACIHSGQLAAPAPSTAYPLAGVVTTVDRSADLVTFRTGSGHLYSLTGCDDWLPGDVIACTMDDNGTPDDVTDDTITQYRYCGYVS